MSTGKTSKWVHIPCLPWSPPGASWMSPCFMLQGNLDSDHTHYLDPETGTEVITTHHRNEPTTPAETTHELTPRTR